MDSKCDSEEEGEKLKGKGTNQVVREGLVGLNLVKPLYSFFYSS